MGNSITVCNETDRDHSCRVHPLNESEKSIEKLIVSNSCVKYKFPWNPTKTFVVSVGDKTVRVVSKTKHPCLQQIENGPLMIVVKDNWTVLATSINDIIENREMDLNWNIVSDKKVKEDDNNTISHNLELLMNLNKQISTIFGMMVGAQVSGIGAGKDMARLASKLSSDVFNEYFKIVLPQLEETADSNTLFKLNEVRHILVATARNISVGFEYFCESIGPNDAHSQVAYLHNILSTITTGNVFPFLEACGLDIAVPIYISAISIVQDIFNMIREINGGHITAAEGTYMGMFVGNLNELWNTCLENIEVSSKIQLTGCFFKKATLRHKGQLIYVIKGIRQGRTKSWINKAKEEFVRSRKCQLEFFYNHPSDFVKRYADKSNTIASGN